LPLGEDLILAVPATQAMAAPTAAGTVNLPIRNTYTSSQLTYVGATKWKDLIDTYYHIVATPVPTRTDGGPLNLLPPDNVPPQTTTIVVSAVVRLGTVITITWTSTDIQRAVNGNKINGSGVTGADLWYRPPGGFWKPAPQNPTQGGTSGMYSFLLDTPCGYRFAVRANDRIGNYEPLEHGTNSANVYVIDCPRYMPVIRR
jgi:hypothetical protein